MELQELKEVLESHVKWLRGEDGGVRANLSGANLFRANLSGANLSGANLSAANLFKTNLSGANLFRANLFKANLSVANLSGANLLRATLSGADLRVANLSGANLSVADLSGANLSWANLSGADLRASDLRASDLRGAVGYFLACPETGAFTAYKKAGGLLVTLEIPSDAKRSSATGRKCRADKAKVLSITDVDGSGSYAQAQSDHDSSFVYEAGKTVEIANFDEDRFNECAHGIHFFITKQEAIDY